MSNIDGKERGSSTRAAGTAQARSVSPKARATSDRQIGQLKGNPGVFIGLEEHGNFVYARYQAIRGTWISASLAARGYDQKYGPKEAFGAYLGIAVDSSLEPIKHPDRIEPGLEYLIPVRPVATPVHPPPAPAPKPYIPPPKSNQTAKPFVEDRRHRLGKDLSVAIMDMPYPSFELNRDPPPPDREPRAAVAYWLLHHSQEILEAERRFNVTRVAIAGIIAWEALENPQVGSFKAVSVGKLHLEADTGEITWAEAAENAGKMPKLTLDERREFLQNSRLGILYIGAVLDLICEDAEAAGFNLRSSPDILGHIYHSRPPKKWAAEIKKKKANAPFSLQPGGIGAWISDNRNYLEAIVGSSQIP